MIDILKITSYIFKKKSFFYRTFLLKIFVNGKLTFDILICLKTKSDSIIKVLITYLLIVKVKIIPLHY